MFYQFCIPEYYTNKRVLHAFYRFSQIGIKGQKHFSFSVVTLNDIIRGHKDFIHRRPLGKQVLNTLINFVYFLTWSTSQLNAWDLFTHISLEMYLCLGFFNWEHLQIPIEVAHGDLELSLKYFDWIQLNEINYTFCCLLYSLGKSLQQFGAVVPIFP